MPREFTTVGVVGLGTMGAGIAEVMARNGIKVIGVEVDDAGLARGRGHLQASVARAVKGGKLDRRPSREALHDRIRFSTSLEDLAAAELVVEAVPEDLELKRSSLPAAGRRSARRRPSWPPTPRRCRSPRSRWPPRGPRSVVGMHFFNPAPVMKLAEVVRTVVTDPEVVDDVEALVRRLGKDDVTCGDRAGFIANALLFGYLNHAVSMYEHRYATREDIDTAMRLGCGLPMGPLALLDLIGIDTAYEILDTMYKQSRDRLHAPAPILKQMVDRRAARPQDRPRLLHL